MRADVRDTLDIPTRDDVLATLPLSRESGRITPFEDGEFVAPVADEFGGE